MNKTYETKPKRQFAALGALLFSATISAPALAENEGAAPFKMAVISNEAYGRSVTSGKFAQAIDSITAGGHRSRDRFADQNNLCVAYTKTSDLEKASVACNAAIARLKRRKSRASTSAWNYSAEGHAYRSELALALSNRGVLLAATGETELAKKDFLAAIELETRSSSFAESNLDRLEQLSTPDA
jgi:tetratricopeptide (TPR) repeat protein